MPAWLQHNLHLKIVLQGGVIFIQLCNDAYSNIQKFGQIESIFEFELILIGVFEKLQKSLIFSLYFKF